jgi:hypothetical protein
MGNNIKCCLPQTQAQLEADDFTPQTKVIKEKKLLSGAPVDKDKLDKDSSLSVDEAPLPQETKATEQKKDEEGEVVEVA